MDRERNAHGASRRATSELALARDVRLGPWGSLIAGAFVGWVAIFAKASIGEAVGDDSGYILLMAAAVAAAWFGGLIGGLTATAVAFILDSVIFLGDGSPGLLSPDRAELTRQILFLIVAIGTVVLVGSRRASRDRLADALDEAAALAEEVAGRDDRLELMLAASGTGFWDWDLVTDDLVWSDAIFEQYGLEPAGPPPDYATYLQTIHPDDREAFKTGVSEAIAGQRSFDLEFRILWPDGSTHWTRGSGRVFRDADGQALRMLGTGQDITERRRIEAQRDAFLLEERRAGEFREAFIDVISHELRTPVTTIMGAAHILARASDPSGSERDSLLVDIHLEAERLHRLVEDLLILTRAERGRLVVEAEPLAIERLLERVVSNIGRELPTIEVTLDRHGTLPIVAGEATYVEQVLRNLLGNAAKYSPAGTSVVVTATRMEDSVEIRVLDSGPGIPADSETRLFELFYRSPEQAKVVAGSGIGLYVCASLVEAMGGRIWAASRPSGGAEFGFTLRILEGDDDGLPSDDERVPRSASGSGTAAMANELSRRV